ncbi:MAG: DUF58 domain-containing protein [Thermoguttaceae bacterium]
MRSSLSREGFYYLGIASIISIGAILREINMMLLFAAFMWMPLLISFRTGRRSCQGIIVRRHIPRPILADEPFVVSMEARNTRPRSWFQPGTFGLIAVDSITFESADSLESKQHSCSPAIYFEYLPSDEMRNKTYAVRLPRRGLYRFGAVSISTRFPFGFLRHKTTASLSEKSDVEGIVFPRIGVLSSIWKQKNRVAFDVISSHSFRSDRESGEFLGLRQWQSGDAKKWIHRRATAKYRKPVVCQFETFRQRDYVIILDTTVLDTNKSDENNRSFRESFELAVSFAATLVYDISSQMSSQIYFATTSGENAFVHGSISQSLIDSILMKLALIEPSLDDYIERTMTQIASNLGDFTEIIFITTTSDASRLSCLSSRVHVVNTSSAEFDQLFMFK